MRKVKTKWVINLSTDSVPKVAVGAVVSPLQTIAEERIKTESVFSLHNDLKKFESELVGKNVEYGKVMFQTGKLFVKKFLAPATGVVGRIDEFNNIYITTGPDQIKIVESPVAAKVVAIGENSMELEFMAYEFTGEGLVEGRVWAKEGLRQIANINELSSKDNGKIIVMNNVLPELLAKAEVVGVMGVITARKTEIPLNVKMPILWLEKDELTDLLKSKLETTALLNAGNGRLLLVI